MKESERHAFDYLPPFPPKTCCNLNLFKMQMASTRQLHSTHSPLRLPINPSRDHP